MSCPPASERDKSMGPRWVSGSEVRQHLTWERAMAGCKEALAAFSRGPEDAQGAVQPVRTSVNIKSQGGFLLVMPGLLLEPAALATKIVTVFPGNEKHGLSTHHALVAHLHPSTGQVLALMDGESITEIRTAAASAVATQLLCGQVDICAILGAGTQARAHARVLHSCFPNSQIRVWARRPEASQALVALLRAEGVAASTAENVEKAVHNADVVCTCTLSPTPILYQNWLKANVHINSVGAPRPDQQELEAELVRNAVVYADSREAALKEAEIGEVLLDRQPALIDQRTIFKSLGLAVEDVISAKIVYDAIVNTSDDAGDRA
ncbi:ketimine reductase mu-crystallin isoform X2 [Oratosquilla oratoria]|uniref:ketimine reductase mu-crystallin isoform X2 n=1 Tax=Oratosquilla oratoria TaxID=337810 RepID=UPI003F764514